MNNEEKQMFKTLVTEFICEDKELMKTIQKEFMSNIKIMKKIFTYKGKSYLYNDQIIDVAQKNIYVLRKEINNMYDEIVKNNYWFKLHNLGKGKTVIDKMIIMYNYMDKSGPVYDSQ